MVDSALYTLFNWENKDLEMFEDAKNAVIASLDVSNADKSRAFSFMNFSLGNTFEAEPFKTLPQLPTVASSGISTPTTTNNNNNNVNNNNNNNINNNNTQNILKPSSPPKSDSTLNSLQDQQNNLIEQRIQDRTTNLRNSIWPTYPQQNNNRVFTNLDMNNVTGQTDLPSIFTNTISSCMISPNRNMQWFNRGSVNNEPWPTDFSQDPTMRSRPCFSSHQTRELEREFGICQYVTRRRRIELAYTLSLTEKQIKTWFQNRRVKERKQKKTTGETIERVDEQNNQTVV